MRRPFAVLVIALCAISMLFAGGTPATATFLTPTVSNTAVAYGVFNDSLGSYVNGVGGVKSYYGSGGKDYDLVTYSTSPSRTLHFVAGSTQTLPFNNAGLPTDFYAQVSSYGVNYYGPYSTMGAGTTAQVHLVVQFHYGRNTYQLDYASIAVTRDATTGVFHFNSDPASLPGYPGFWPSDIATLSLVRKGGNVNYGSPNMPIKFDVQ